MSVLEESALKFRPGLSKRAIRKSDRVRKLLVAQDLRVDAVSSVVHELAAPADVIPFAEKLEHAFSRLWLSRC
jgi:hypothetical protein